MTEVQERRPAWSKRGVDVSGLTFEDAIVAARIDYEVKSCDAYARIPVNEQTGLAEEFVSRQIAGRKHTYRTDTLEPLGEVGERYHVVQTREARDFVEAVIGGGWQPEFAGGLQGGKAIFIVGRLPFKTSEEIDPYLAVVNSFDGSTGLRICSTPIRPACTNAIRRTFKEASAAISLRHTANLSSRVDFVRTALKLTTAYYNRLDDEIEKLIATELDEQRMKMALNMLFEFKPSGDTQADSKAYERNQERRFEFTQHLNSTPTIPKAHRHTAWGFINAVSEREQWFSRNANTPKFEESLLGQHIGLVPAVSKAERIQKFVAERWLAPF